MTAVTLEPALALTLLILITVANGAPILAHRLLGRHLGWPLDGGLVLPDRRRLLGEAKTLRGVISALLLTPPAAWLLGQAWWVGGLIALGAMLGDILSSFIKRRLGLPPSSQALLLDQVPEAALPLVLVWNTLELNAPFVGMLVSVFVVMELLLSKLLYRLRIRRQPY